MRGQEEFSITTERHDHCVVLVVRGDLDEITADTLDRALKAVNDGRPAVVDLSETSFICSASIHVLTKDRPQGRPALVAPEGRLTKVLRIVEAYRTNRMFVDQPAALQSLQLAHLAAVGSR